MTSASADDLPDTVGKILREANSSERSTIENVLKRLYPDKRQAVDDLVDEIKDEEKARIASLKFIEGWEGEVSLGASLLTGNSDEWSISGEAKIKRKGPSWEHRLQASVDLNTVEGERTDERMSADYRINYDFRNSRWFVTGQTWYDHDRFKGIDRRFTETVGIGYDIFDEDEFSLEVLAGPALRQTAYTTGEHDNQLAALLSTELEWEISDTLTFNQDAHLVIDNNDNSLESTTSLTKNLFGKLSMRLSFTVDWESDPVEGNEKLDTRSRGSLVMDF